MSVKQKKIISNSNPVDLDPVITGLLSLRIANEFLVNFFLAEIHSDSCHNNPVMQIMIHPQINRFPLIYGYKILSPGPYNKSTPVRYFMPRRMKPTQMLF